MNAIAGDVTALAREKHPAAQATIRRWEELKSSNQRPEHEESWDEIARLIRPQRGGHSLSDPSGRRHEKPLSSEPIMAASSFAAGLYAGLTNPANRWGGLETPDEDLNKWKPMAEWNDIATRRVIASFTPALSSFYPATFQGYADIAAFGNMFGYDELDQGKRRFIDVTLSLAEVVWEVDAWGRVWGWIRKFRLVPGQALKLFKDRGPLPDKIREAAETNATEKFTFYQHVLINEDWQPGRIGPRGKAYVSRYVCEEGECLISERGYDDMPGYVARWDVDSGHTIGTGPGFIALASARVNHEMEASALRARQFASDPTLLAPGREDWQLNGQVRPGYVVYGGLNMRGDQMLRPLQTGAWSGLTDQDKLAKVEEIKNAFHYALMTVQGRTGMTSEETLIMEEARMRNWAPHSDRIMEEYAARKFERRFRLLWKVGQIPPPPAEAQGLPLQVRYQSAAAMAMKAREGLAVRQFLADLAPLAQAKPRVMDRLDEDALVEVLHEASPSLPAKLLRGRDEADKIAAERAQQAQMAQAMAMAREGAGALKDVAGAAAAVQPQGMAEGAPQ